MGGGPEIALVLAIVAAVSSATWVSRDLRRRDVGSLAAGLVALLVLATFPLGVLAYARWRRPPST